MFVIDILYPTGAVPTYPPISPQSLRWCPFEGVHTIFKGHCLNLYEQVGWVGGTVGWPQIVNNSE
ncbi:MAG: hypothetical protein PVH84_11140 [Candidatus Aminicenantes bacterium]